jgi:hypothetical protein
MAHPINCYIIFLRKPGASLFTKEMDWTFAISHDADDSLLYVTPLRMTFQSGQKSVTTVGGGPITVARNARGKSCT